MKLSPEMIREQRFKARLSGFDKTEVIAFLMDIAEDLEMLIEENSLLKSELETAKRRQRDMEDLFLSVKQFSEERMKRADIDAKGLVAEAEKKASEIQAAAGRKLAEAEQRAHEIHAQAMQKAREILKEAERTKNDMEHSLEEIRSRRDALMSELKSVFESYQAWIQANVV